MSTPSYFAVIMPEIRYDNRLSASEKLFFAEITALTNMNGKCFASNSYFAELYGVSTSTISLWVKNLCKSGHIDVDYEYNGKQIVKRFISLKNPSGIHKFNPTGGSQISDDVVRKSDGGSQISDEGWSENRKDNNTLTESNTNPTDSNKKGTAYTPEFESAWIAYERKGSKKHAYREWKKVGKDEHAKIVASIPKYLQSNEFQYRKDFERYISSGRYEGMETKEAEAKNYWKDWKPAPDPTSTRAQYANYGDSVG